MVGRRKVVPVERRRWSRKSGSPTSRTTMRPCFHQPHAVAVQAVVSGDGAGRDGSGGNPGDRGKDRAMLRTPLAALPQAMQVGRVLGRHPVAADTIAADQDDASRDLHGATVTP
jgi:hypothetical protein